jgi:hypothetical protein
MLPRKVDARENRIVWRMTMADPVSVDIDLTDLKSKAEVLLDVPDHGWLESSYELRQGLHVREVPMDKLPDDLIKAFTKSRR